jgi:hypothetical protein
MSFDVVVLIDGKIINNDLGTVHWHHCKIWSSYENGCTENKLQSNSEQIEFESTFANSPFLFETLFQKEHNPQMIVDES